MRTHKQPFDSVRSKDTESRNKKIPACRVRHGHTVRRQIVGLLGQGGGGGISPDARESTGRITDATRYVRVAFLLFICTVPSNSTMLLYISYCTVYSTLPSLVLLCLHSTRKHRPRSE